MRQCTYPGCGSTKRVIRGMCEKHYKHWYDHLEVKAPTPQKPRSVRRRHPYNREQLLRRAKVQMEKVLTSSHSDAEIQMLIDDIAYNLHDFPYGAIKEEKKIA